MNDEDDIPENEHDDGPPGSPVKPRLVTGLSDEPDLTALLPKQEEAIIALMSEPTVKRAAESVGIGERTLHRWLSEPDFASAYRLARRQAFSQAVAICHRFAALAVGTLAKVASDTTSPHAARVSAATALLRFSRESIELDDLMGRVEALEAGMKAANFRPGLAS